MKEHESSYTKKSFTNAQEMTDLGENPPKMQSDAEVRYVSPSEQSPDDMPQHKFELILDGADIDYFSKPLPQ